MYHDNELMSCSCAEWTEVAQLLPSIPKNESENTSIVSTLKSQPDLFDVSTPINVDNFERLLVQHPNPLFVKSVMNGLRYGFWPWADTQIGIYPDISDESLDDPADPDKLKFICEQRDKEIKMGRFSRAFGSKQVAVVQKRAAVVRTDGDGEKQVVVVKDGRWWCSWALVL